MSFASRVMIYFNVFCHKTALIMKSLNSIKAVNEMFVI